MKFCPPHPNFFYFLFFSFQFCNSKDMYQLVSISINEMNQFNHQKHILCASDSGPRLQELWVESHCRIHWTMWVRERHEYLQIFPQQKAFCGAPQKRFCNIDPRSKQHLAVRSPDPPIRRSQSIKSGSEASIKNYQAPERGWIHLITIVTSKKSPNVYKSCPKWFHKKIFDT